MEENKQQGVLGMKIKCDYCESIYDDSLGKCPHCGAPTPTVGHSASGTPKTIEELKKYVPNLAQAN